MCGFHLGTVRSPLILLIITKAFGLDKTGGLWSRISNHCPIHYEGNGQILSARHRREEGSCLLSV